MKYRHLYPLLCFFLAYCSVYTHAQVITTYAGSGSAGYSGNGAAATLASLDSPTCLAVDAAGNIYINDQRNSSVRKVDPTGVITTVAGTGSSGFSGDGGAATLAKLNLNWGIATDAGGNIYIADQKNNRIRKVTPAGIISTIAGTDSAGYRGDGGPATAAWLNAPIGIAVDNTGNVFFGDGNNFCVRKINTAGIISTFAGNRHYGFSGDGHPAVSAQLSYIWGLAADATGNLYICDGGNNRLRKVNTAGIISTVAGNGSAGYSGDGHDATSAKFNLPIGVYVNNGNEIFITDCHNNCIRKVNTAGIITTIAGTGYSGFDGDGGPAINAKLAHPVGVVQDASENMYLSDLLNVRVRRISNGKTIYFTAGHTQTLSVCENAADTSLDSMLTIVDNDLGLTDTWSTIDGPAHGSAIVTFSATSTGGIITPSGLSYKPDAGFTGKDTLRVKVSNGTAADTTIIYITVIPHISTAGIITGDSMVCVGSAITLTDSVLGGFWSSANGSTAVLSIPPFGVVRGLRAGLDTIVYTLSNSCGMAVATKTVLVNPLPDSARISGPSAVCRDASVLLGASPTGGSWNDSGIHTSLTVITPDTVSITGHIPGIDTVKYTVFNTYCAATVTHAIRVEVFPKAGFIVGPSHVCTGLQITLTDAVGDGVWLSSPGNTAVQRISKGTATITGVTPGTDTVSYNITNSCGTASATANIEVDSLPGEPSISQSGNILQTSPGYAAYQWLFNNAPIAGATFDTCSANELGAYSVIVTNTYGCSAESKPANYDDCSAADISVYPIPTSSKVFVKWCKKLTIKLMCADGRAISVTDNVNEIDLSSLPNATYFIALYHNGNKLKTERVVKWTK